MPLSRSRKFPRQKRTPRKGESLQDLKGRILRAIRTPDLFSRRRFELFAQKLQRHQARRNPVYRRWVVANAGRFDFLPIVAFKESNPICFPISKAAVVFESSGTTRGAAGERGRHGFRSMELYQASVLSGWKWFLEQSEWKAPGSFLALMPSDRESPKSSLSRMLGFLMDDSPGGKHLWGMKNQRWCWDSAARYLSQNRSQPLVAFGTAFGWVHFLDWVAREKKRFKLHPESIVIETGGYKGKSRELSRKELHGKLASTLGLPGSRIRSEYSMCELSSQAYSFPTRGGGQIFRFPPWVQARIVSAGSEKAVKIDDQGVLMILDLANVDSCGFIRTEDMAIRKENGFELLGRLPAAGLKGCSLTFEELR
jgi:hypothetical protein